MNILVFGGSGFIGRNIANRLCRKHIVTVVDNNQRGYSDLGLDDFITLRQVDVTDRQAVFDIVKNCDVLINLAYVNGTKNFYDFPEVVFDIAIRGQLNICDAINKIGVKHFLYASSSEVYQDPGIFPTPEQIPLVIPDIENPRFSYGGGKIVGELICKFMIQNIETKTVFRPHNVFGPNMGNEHVIPNLIHKILTSTDGSITIQGSGKETRSFCYVDDMVDAVELLVHDELPGTYNIGTENETSILELVEEISAIIGKNINILSTEKTLGSVSRRLPDISKIKAHGFDPKWSLTAGLQNTIDWYRENYG
jgi:UDP-glucose 4-epimerase